MFDPSFVANVVPAGVVTVAHPPRIPLTSGVVLTLMFPTEGSVNCSEAAVFRVITPALNVTGCPPLLTATILDDVPAVSEDFKRARDVIVTRVTTLLEDPAITG